MDSVIKWQTGKPKVYGRYIITTKWKEVTSDWYDEDLGWHKYFDKDIIAWCHLTDVEPYKE